MRTVKSRAVAYFVRHRIGTFDLIHRAASGGKSRKATEAALAELRAEGRIVALPFIGTSKLYVVTPKFAREYGLGEKRFSRPPGAYPITRDLTIAHFCQRHGFTLLTRREFAKVFPELAAIKKFETTRYYLDPSSDPPILSLIVPDFYSKYQNVVKKARREMSLRKGFAQFRKFICNGMFQVTLVTAVEQKAELLRYALKDEKDRYVVYVVPEIFKILEVK